MPNHKNSNMNNIVINVNSNNKTKKGSKKQRMSAPDKPQMVPMAAPQSTYINNSAPPQYNGTLDVDRSVAHGVQQINDQINLLQNRREFLDAYEANQHQADPVNVRLEASLGRLNQSRIRADGSSVQPLALSRDNLESHLEQRANRPGISFYQGGAQVSPILSSSSLDVNHDNVQTRRGHYEELHGEYGLGDDSRPRVADEPRYVQQPEKHDEASLRAYYARNRANPENDETLLSGLAAARSGNPNRPTDPYGDEGHHTDEDEADTSILDGPFDENAFDLNKFKKLAPENQYIILKKLDARRNRSQIIKLAEDSLVDLTDDDNKPKKIKTLKREILESFHLQHGNIVL